MDMMQQPRKYYTALDEYFDKHVLNRSRIIAEVIKGADNLD